MIIAFMIASFLLDRANRGIEAEFNALGKKIVREKWTREAVTNEFRRRSQQGARADEGEKIALLFRGVRWRTNIFGVEQMLVVEFEGDVAVGHDVDFIGSFL